MNINRSSLPTQATSSSDLPGQSPSTSAQTTSADLIVRDVFRDPNEHSKLKSFLSNRFIELIKNGNYQLCNIKPSVLPPYVTQLANAIFSQLNRHGPAEWVCEKIRDEPLVVHVRNESGSLLIHSATRKKTPTILKCLINNGADINAVHTDGDTALHIAIKRHSIKCLEILLESGADYNLKNNKGQTPFEVASDIDMGQGDRTVILALLKKRMEGQ